MPKLTFRIPGEGEPLLDIVSYGRGGPSKNGSRLPSEQVEQIRRTVQRVPEVMVKVLSRASSDLKAAGKHIDYISRHGEVELESDAGESLKDGSGQALLEEWDLDIDDARRQAALAGSRGRNPAKLVHKLMFSMPAGTAPNKVVAAVRNFAREEFWGQHRYAFALHTDEEHPHVHLVLKAVSEQGVRLNIKKATLRHWRSKFAHNLRLLGVPANATERAVRGQGQKAMKDGIYRSSLRGGSVFARAKVESVATELRQGHLHIETGKGDLLKTRETVEKGWRAVAARIAADGDDRLASEIQAFVQHMLPARTEREWIASQIGKSVQQVPIRAR
jgi:hypothetical protein